MQTKIIKCPKCGTILEVKNSKNEEFKIVKCPTCSSQLRVKFQPQQQMQEVIDAETQIGSGKTDSGKTEIAEKPKASKAFLVHAGTRYQLAEGRNIVGRMAKDSNADVKIETKDRYMSRLNTIINVRKVDKELMVSITTHKNLNPIFVGKVQILDGDEIMLQNGDTITMGETKIKLLIE